MGKVIGSALLSVPCLFSCLLPPFSLTFLPFLSPPFYVFLHSFPDAARGLTERCEPQVVSEVQPQLPAILLRYGCQNVTHSVTKIGLSQRSIWYQCGNNNQISRRIPFWSVSPAYQIVPLHCNYCIALSKMTALQISFLPT